MDAITIAEVDAAANDNQIQEQNESSAGNRFQKAIAAWRSE